MESKSKAWTSEYDNASLLGLEKGKGGLLKIMFSYRQLVFSAKGVIEF